MTLDSEDLAAIAEIVWDEPLTGTTHNVPTSAGRVLREVGASVIVSGVAAGPGNGYNQIQLDNDASSQDGAYDPATISIVLGTGAGQSRGILQYEGSTKIATVDRNWKVQPDVTSEYVINAWPGREGINEGLFQGNGSDYTVTLNTLASSDDDAYKGQLIFVRSGPGEDQVRLITGYNGTTKVATVAAAWVTHPTSDSAYMIIPTQIPSQADMVAAIWGSDDAGGVSYGDGIVIIRRMLEGKVTKLGNIVTVFEEDGSTPWRQYDLSDGERLPV